MAIVNALPPTLKARPALVAPIVDALVNLYKDMPPHIKGSEVKSVTHTLKNAFLAVLKYPPCALLRLSGSRVGCALDEEQSSLT